MRLEDDFAPQHFRVWISARALSGGMHIIPELPYSGIGFFRGVVEHHLRQGLEKSFPYAPR